MSGEYFDYKNWEVAETFEDQFEDRELNDLFSDLFCAPISERRSGGVVGALDLYKSADWSRDSYLAVVRRFKRKWFKTSRDKRLQGYVDAACGSLKRELTELIGASAQEAAGRDTKPAEVSPIDLDGED